MSDIALFNSLTANTKLETRVMFYLYLRDWDTIQIRSAKVCDVVDYLKCHPTDLIDLDSPSLFFDRSTEDLAFAYASGRLVSPSRFSQTIKSIIEKTGEYTLSDSELLKGVIL